MTSQRFVMNIKVKNLGDLEVVKSQSVNYIFVDVS